MRSVSVLFCACVLTLSPVRGRAHTLSRPVSHPPCEVRGAPPPIPDISLERIASGLDKPLYLTHSGDGSGRLFIVEQAGVIRIWQGGRLFDRPFLDIRDRVRSGGEMGLLSVAFHPGFSRNRLFYVNYTSSAGGLHTVVSEFRVGDDPTDALEMSEQIVLTITQPFPNHNGGLNLFGPDGYLYIGMGDGGAGNDPFGHGQNLSTLLGKMLRIDVSRKGGAQAYTIPPDNPFVGREDAAPEIWAYGLRNPWRFSFDALTGELYLGDVGQNAREEIDVIRKGGNYGWNIMEGSICTPGVNPLCAKSGLELPILDYGRMEGTTVIGGFVYRGKAIPGLCGAYLYGDYGRGRIWALRYDGRSVTDHKELLDTRYSISSFGEDEEHELYVVDHGGQVFMIRPSVSEGNR